jgi:hypothetical protein
MGAMAVADQRGRVRRPRRLPTRDRFPGWRVLLVQVLLVGGAAIAYFAIRNLTQGALAQSIANARRVVDIEVVLGIDWETGLQSLIIDRRALVTLVNWLYIYGHWPMVGATLALLFVLVPSRYYLLRNAMFISGAIGLVFFALLPVAPPRFGILDLVDTVTQRSSSYRALQPPGLINRYAALPSLHFGWNLLVGIVLWQTTRNRAVRAFVLIMVPAMAFAVVATANHYVFDVVVGGVVALAGLAAARALPSVRATPAWARAPE